MIRTQAELNAALDRCKGGETIDSIQLDTPARITGRSFATPVTIAGMVVRSTASLAAPYSPLLQILGCSGLIFDGLTVTGQPKPDRGFLGRGVLVDKGADIIFTRSRFTELWNGITSRETVRLRADRSDFHRIQADGIIAQQLVDFAAVGNHFRYWFPVAPDHADAIQFHSNNGATDDFDGAVMTDNLIDFFPDDEAQGLFCADAKFGGHRRVLIERNICFSTMWNAIAVASCKDPVVRNNRTYKLVGARYDPRIVTLGVSATLEGNEAAAYALKAHNTPVPAGNAVAPPIALATFEDLRRVWLAEHRPVPGPTPAPAPIVTPAPTPPAEPAPEPTPVTKPVDVVQLTTEAIDLINQAENTMGRAMARMIKIKAALAAN